MARIENTNLPLAAKVANSVGVSLRDDTKNGCVADYVGEDSDFFFAPRL